MSKEEPDVGDSFYMSQKNISFVINYEGTPTRKLTSVTLYAFDPKGELIASAELKRNQAQLSLTDAQGKKTRANCPGAVNVSTTWKT